MRLNPRILFAAAAVSPMLVVVALGGAANFLPVSLVSLGPDDCDVIDCSSEPQDVALADFDGDGVLDVVTANIGSDDVTVLLNSGDGTFSVASTTDAPLAPVGVAVADFDEDGNVDAAVASQSASAVAVYPGNGDGTLGAPNVIEFGVSLENIVAADFDEDGHADFATTDLFGQEVVVHLGNGDGTFAISDTVAISGGPSGIAAGNFDGGAPDLVVTLDDDFPGEVAILLGDGAGGFTVQMPFVVVGDTPLSVAVGDLDEDGEDDLAVANWADDSVSVLFGNGDGTFADGPLLDAGILPEDIAIADLDGDLALDIVSLDSFGEGAVDGFVVVHAGNGDGTFEDFVIYDSGAGPSGVAVGDLDGSDTLDVVTVHVDSDDAGVLLNAEGGNGGDCVGDCDGDGMVSIAELVRGVNIALGQIDVSECTAFDRNSDGMVSISELVAAVNSALGGCDS